MQKVRNSGKSGHFEFSTTGRWQMQVIHGWDIWIDGKSRYERYSPREVAVAEALRLFWIQNRGARFKWQETLANLRFFVRKVGRLTRNNLDRAKEIIRELGPMYMSPGGEVFVYASTRGSNAVAGFVTVQSDAVRYEAKSHEMFQVMEGRVANGTVEPASTDFAIPVHNRSMTTKTLR